MAYQEVKNQERLSSEVLIRMCKEMIDATCEPEIQRIKQNDGVGDYYEALRIRFTDLEERYPAIFRMIMEKGRDMDMERLEYMLRALGSIKSGTVDKTAKLREVSQKLHEAYNVPFNDPDAK